MAEFVGSAASQADFIWKNAEDLWGGIDLPPRLDTTLS